MNAKQELFEMQLNEYGCGYYKSCWEHACPCNISIKCNGIYNEKIDQSLRDEAKRVAEELENEFDYFDDDDEIDDDEIDDDNFPYYSDDDSDENNE